ncbi:MAG: efflux RND transporter periplasmic adaptor subunit [bacterium]|nr:efflux RND transporter periplasmic adaptor subunit [bacterium]
MKRKRRIIIGSVIAVVVILLIWLLTKGEAAPVYSTVTVEAGPLTQTVSETGTVKPVKEVALNFLTSGRINAMPVKIGDKVVAGTELASLDDSALLSRRAEAAAGLQIAQASLSKILAGASSENIAVSRSNLTQAQSSAASAKVDLNNVKSTVAENIRQAQKALADLESKDPSTPTPAEQAIASAQTALDNAKLTGAKNVENARNSATLTLGDKILSAKIALDNINTILEDDAAKDVLSVKNSALLTRTKDARAAALALVAPAEQAVAAAKVAGTESSINDAGIKVKALLLATNTMLDAAYGMLEATITSVDFPQSRLDSFKTLVSTQSAQVNAASNATEAAVQGLRNAILASATGISSAEEGLRQAEIGLDNAIIAARNALSSARLGGDQQIAAAQARSDSAEQSIAVAQAQLTSTMAPARAQDVSLAQAQVTQAQAALAGIDQQLADSRLVAPLDGIVTQVNYEVGEQFGMGGKPAVSILVNNSFNIEVDIAESNISKIKVGDQADVTLDAFPDDFILKGVVSFIEPAQTLIADIVYYKVKIDFADLSTTLAQLETRAYVLKAGMTANVVITTDSRADTMSVPARAIIDKDGQAIVRLLVNKELKEVPVVTGLRGDEGKVEILSGIKAGDEVITFIQNGDK